jgi:hypothetical protein
MRSGEVPGSMSWAKANVSNLSAQKRNGYEMKYDNNRNIVINKIKAIEPTWTNLSWRMFSDGGVEMGIMPWP